MTGVNFKKTVIGELINDVGSGPMNTFSTVYDIDGDGRPDFIVCGRNGVLAWFKNEGRNAEWTKNLIDNVEKIECGGSVIDLDGDGLPDIICGGDWRSDEVYWWQNPGTQGDLWTKRVAAKTGYTQFHDTLVGDITNDGVKALIFTNQHADGGTNIYWVPLPEDPTVSPWPGLRIVGSGKSEINSAEPYDPNRRQPEEGLAIGDIDGDGKNELVAGTHWYKYNGADWECHKFAFDYVTTKIAIGDIDGDGKNEIVLSEGDPFVYGKNQGGKVAWFKPGDDITKPWTEHVLDEGLTDAHSLQLGDIAGNGRLDILVGEVGVADDRDMYAIRPPRVMIFENLGNGVFRRHIIDEGTGIHDALLIDIDGDGRPDIIGKPLHGEEKWNLHVYYNLGDR